MTVEWLMGAAIALGLGAACWHYGRRFPLETAVLAFTGLLVWTGTPPLLVAVAAGTIIAYRRSGRLRSAVHTAAELAGIGLRFCAGLADEVRAYRHYERKLCLRALREIRASYRAGVAEGEKQLPTTVAIDLHPDDYVRFDHLDEVVCDELEAALGRSTGFRKLAAPKVMLAVNPAARWRGWPKVRVSFSAGTSLDAQADPDGMTTPTRTGRFLRLDANDEVLADRPLVFGRDRVVADVVIDDRHISRRHARYEPGNGGHAYIVDRSSTNGTFVNGVKVSGRQPIRDGDRLRLGREVTFRYVAGEETDPTAPNGSGCR